MKQQIAALLLASSFLALTGCDSSIESQNAAAYQDAAVTSHNYDNLKSTLEGAVDRLTAIRKTPVSASNFMDVINAVDKQVGEANDALRSSRNQLISTGTKQVDSMNAQAAKFSDPDNAKKVRDEAEKIRAAYIKYQKESEEIFTDIDEARKQLADVRRMMNVNSSATGIENSIESVKKAESALKDAKKDIPDAYEALEKLSKILPRAPIPR